MNPWRSGARARLVGVADYFGAGNVGDDLMIGGLLAVLAAAEARGEGPFELVLPTPHRILSQMRRFPEVTWCRPGPGYEAALAEADLLLLPGGTPFMPQHRVWERIAPRVAQGEPHPLLCLAVGAEVEAAEQLPAAKALLERACFTTARDETSAKVLRELTPGRSGLIAEGADLANIPLRTIFRHVGEPPQDRPTPLAILWFREGEPLSDADAVAEFVARRGDEARPVFLSHEFRLFAEFRLFRRLYPRGTPHPRFLRPRYGTPDLASLVIHYRAIGTVLSSRYHSLLAAAWAGCRVAALPRSLKVVGAARTLGIPIVDRPLTVRAMERGVAEARTVPRAALDDLAHRALETGVEALCRALPPAATRRRLAVPPARSPQAPRILVVRQDAIGDQILTSALLRELRQSFREASITLVTSLLSRPLFAHCPYIDGLVPYDFSGWGRPRARAAQAALFAETVLRPMAFDIALLPRYGYDHQGGRAIVAASGAAVRVGYAAGLSPSDRHFIEAVGDPFSVTLAPGDVRHEVERNLAVLEAIGGTVTDRQLELWPSPEDRRDPAGRLLRLRGGCDAPLVALAPGASRPHKLWPLERFIETGRALVRQFGSRIVIVGGGREVEAGAAFRAALGDAAIDLTGQLSLNRTFAAIEACDLLITNDSAPVHLAAAAGTPVVVVSAHPIDGDPNASLSPLRFGPWMVAHRVLQPPARREPCRETCTAPDPHCILDVTDGAVIAAATDLLESTMAKGGPIADAAALARLLFPAPTRRPSATERRMAEATIRYWREHAETNGPGWKERAADGRLSLFLGLLGLAAEDLAASRVLIAQDGPFQTLSRLKARQRVAIDPRTAALVEAGLIETSGGRDEVAYLPLHITDDVLPPGSFDVVMLNGNPSGNDEAAKVLASALRLVARGGRIAVNLQGPDPGEGLSVQAVAEVLGARPHVSTIERPSDRNVLRGTIALKD